MERDADPGFLTIGSSDPADPGPGHETLLRTIELGEHLGLDSAWLRHRHLHPDTADVEDFGRGRASRLLSSVHGEAASTFSGTRGTEVFSDRVQPRSPGLAQRLWCGAASTGSARWAGEQGLNLLTSSVVEVEEGERYAAYAASRRGRDGVPQGPARLLFAPDLVGPAEQIAQTLHDDPTFAAVREVAFALPFSFREEDHAQMLTDIATRLGPAPGWEPSHATGADDAGADRHVGEVRPGSPPAG